MPGPEPIALVEPTRSAPPTPTDEIPMCDYCGCRDLTPAIGELSEEHERMLDLGYRLRRAVAARDHAAALEVLDGLEPLVGHHTDKEEQGLFSALREVWGADDRLDTLVGEHEEVDALLAEVRRGDPGWPDAAERAVAVLSQHLLDEETDLFPYAMYELSPTQWERVEAVHDAHGPAPDLARQAVA
jgi:hemerythrin-like domain-containing protein